MFNWVHTKFHYNPLKDGNTSRKKGESVTKEAKTQGLLAEQVDEFVDDWRINNGRRLTIFFMGFEKSAKTKTYFNLRKEGKRDNEDIIIVDNAEDDDDDELIPLMSTTFQNNFDDSNGEFCTEFEKFQVVVAIQRHVAHRIRRRVTLADLLMVDVHGNKPKPSPEAEIVPVPDFPKKLVPEVETDRGSCFSEKLKAAPEPPTRNLRRLMGKMMKRKIHAKVHNEQLLGQDNKLHGKLFDPTSLPILPVMASDPKLFVFDEVAKHNHQADCWLIISGKVYDVTPFLEDHPGGDEVLLLATEKDATEDFETVSHSLDATEEMEKYYIGNIDMSTVPKPADHRPPASKSESTATEAATETTSSAQSSGSLIKVLQVLIPLLIIGVAIYLQYYGKKQ